jgi:hypothetical protein
VAGKRGTRALESKWGIVKHDVSKYITAYKQIKDLKKSGVTEDDIRRMARELYKSKHAKGSEFTYEHVWALVKDYPKWFDGGTCSSNVTPSKRRASTSDQGPGVESADTTSNLHSAPEMAGSAWQGACPTRTKAAKEAQKNLKVKEAAAYKQAKATELLAEAALRKTALMEEHNLILLMTATDAQGQPSATATEFLALRQKEELQKLKARSKLQEAAEEARLQSEMEQAARERAEAAAEELTNNETRRQVREAAASGGNTSDLDETRCSDDVPEDGEDEDTDILGFQSSGGQAGAGVGSGGGGSQFEFASPPPAHHFDVGDQPSL